ncbi:hypothetical protein CANCADRAFT_30299 [Tortispora caseinolytica NRRL Y-17796]|uniref:Sodium/calcium exchanger membrane region domain-containing protein n=1 Tax=Tortispora caseinolytica NRRL Y-17796 TaxID=767744 RepID=A0A1E4TJV4_9ASCO|nr:hypothetical protein CANCADRAFT_30299 [Tortispora caseinolytica NRRL Y-17796]
MVSDRDQDTHRLSVFSVDDDQSEVQNFDPESTSRHRLPRRTPRIPGADSIAPSIPEHFGELGEIDDADDLNSPDNVDVVDYDPSIADSFESFTLRDKQAAINVTHPFGIRIWKPALYKKLRSVQKNAEADIHSSPNQKVTFGLWLGNALYTITFGLLLFVFCTSVSAAILCFAWIHSAQEYGFLTFRLGLYLLTPYKYFVVLTRDENYLLEDSHEGRSLGDYYRWQAGDLEGGRLVFGPTQQERNSAGQSTQNNSHPNTESSSSTDPLLSSSQEHPYIKRRLFGRGSWNFGRILFYISYYAFLLPVFSLMSLILYFLVFSIPMAKVLRHMSYFLRRHPLALGFIRTNSPMEVRRAESKPILLCTHTMFSPKYYKYTVDGTNIFLINLMAIVVFVIFDNYLFRKILGVEHLIASPYTIFVLSLASVIPLAYFIGQAVASISAQSSMGLAAVINALFSTIVEVFLYSVALYGGKGDLVEGSIVGSILAGILALPGMSMVGGATYRKTQRYNPKSAGVSSTMLMFAIVCAFIPTIFYQIFGSYELNCRSCSGDSSSPIEKCKECHFFQVPLDSDYLFQNAVRPLCYICAVLLFVSYLIGLWFTLRTHAALIWQSATTHEDTHPVRRAGEPSSDRSLGIATSNTVVSPRPAQDNNTRHSRKFSTDPKKAPQLNLTSLSKEDNDKLNEFIAAVTTQGAASTSKVHNYSVSTGRAGLKSRSNSTANTSALRQRSSGASQNLPTGTSSSSDAVSPPGSAPQKGSSTQQQILEEEDPFLVNTGADSGGHDAPNWSKKKSTFILLGATVLYAVIAEILVDTVDVVISKWNIDAKFLGITLFAVIPNTTEFLNAISFAMHGNIALSMEIGSAYVLQVCLLQMPALVFISIFTLPYASNLHDFTFTLVFPQWDALVVILCTLLFLHIYQEGKSNYFKGSILILAYLAVMCGFFFSSFADSVTRFRSIIITQ